MLSCQHCVRSAVLKRGDGVSAAVSKQQDAGGQANQRRIFLQIVVQAWRPPLATRGRNGWKEGHKRGAGE